MSISLFEACQSGKSDLVESLITQQVRRFNSFFLSYCIEQIFFSIDHLGR